MLDWEKTVTKEMLTPVYRKFSDVIGIEAAIALCKAFGGCLVTIPKIDPLFKKAVRNKEIFRKWQEGLPFSQIVKQYGLSDRMVRIIVDKQLEERRQSRKTEGNV